ncbi:MAG TPA: biotin/lipoyl-containing protein [Candidatus Limnocylindrales bacterium]|nr:biotin/lipoyl-containing protein [Candidatus Limnocylindrales bacterium]
MSDNDHVFGLLDDLMKLIERSPAATIEVEADSFSVTVTRRGGVVSTAGIPTIARDAASAPPPAEPEAASPKTQRVHATSVGIFNGPRSWSPGDAVTRGEVLGGIQTLGHVSEVKAPADGEMREVLVTTGAPVEYGQTLFVIAVG